MMVKSTADCEKVITDQSFLWLFVPRKNSFCLKVMFNRKVKIKDQKNFFALGQN